MTTTRTETTVAVLDALHEVHVARRTPTKRAGIIARVLIELSTQAEVDYFVAELRREAGCQDIALLPDTAWLLTRYLGDGERAPGGQVVTEELVELIGDSPAHLDWPSVTFHWGVAVRWTNETGVEWTARSADWRLTETYMSS